MTLKYLFQLIWFLWLIEPLAATPFLAKPFCNDTCGSVTIPYPFGIGPGCFLDEWYEVLCYNDRPYLSKYYEQQSRSEVLHVSLNSQTITINANTSNYRVCNGDSLWIDGNFSGSPFFYDVTNMMIIVGCGRFTLSDNRTFPSSCTSTCSHENTSSSGCFGINCCKIPIQSLSQKYYVNISNSMIGNNSCPSVILANIDWYNVSSVSSSDPSQNLVGVSAPVDLRWTIPYMPNNTYCYSNYGWYRCDCPICTEGNPYIMSCQGVSNYTNCISTIISNSKKTTVLLVVGMTSLGILVLATTSLLLYKTISKRRERQLKEKFFKRNGGLLLQQQLSVDENIVDKVRFFTSSELDKATDHFNENRVLGHGGQGTVYKGMLVDGKIVAVKKSKLVHNNQVEFINEIVVLSQINHRNVVKLLGCCLETDVPLLVYEFIQNGTLYDLIHNENDEFLISWDMRLRIASEIAGALAYLHSATSIPIYHRDIKSSNILLAEKFIAKVSDFGISRHVTIDQTHLTTMVKGTFGYLDPEYFQTHQFTEKSDVYSFGVVLLELLTRQKPISSTDNTAESGLSLAARFLIAMEEDHLNMILDTQVLNTASDEQVKIVAMLAQRCLNLDGKRRPTMKEVVMELERIKTSHVPSTVQTNFLEKSGTGEELVIFSDGISSSTTANGTTTFSSDAYPLLFYTF